MGGGVRQIERQRRREDWADLAGVNAIVWATKLTACQREGQRERERERERVWEGESDR